MAGVLSIEGPGEMRGGRKMKRMVCVLLTVLGVCSFCGISRGADPSPDIKAWGSDGPLRITPSNVLSLSVGLDAGSFEGRNADWWVAAATPFGPVYLDLMEGSWSWVPGISVTYQGPLFGFPDIEIVNVSGLPEGEYTFYFGVDLNMNGLLDLDQLYYDVVQVTVAGSHIFIKDPESRYIIDVAYTHGGGTGGSRPLPVNQILLMFDEGVSPSEAQVFLESMQEDFRDVGLSLVGQIPSIGIYQLEIENTAADITRLDTVITSLRSYPRVETVSYNEPLEFSALENDDDNSGITRRNRCALASIDYYQAIPIFDAVRSHLHFNRANVAVIDSGLWLGSGQFDEIRSRLVNLDDPASDPFDPSPTNHGTSMASIIAADNRDGRINGIALRVLGDHLTIMVARATLYGNRVYMHWALAGVRQAVDRGARVINLSLSSEDNGSTPSWLRNQQAQFMRLFKLSPQALFVASAPNEPFVLNNNAAPAGLPNSNLITVGGLESCDFMTRFSQSARGPGIDIGAPATGIPLCCLGNDMTGPIDTVETGNSVSAAIVTSIAAIVLSLDPSRSGAQLKAFLTDDDHVWPASPDVGGRRPALIKTVGSAILRGSASSAAVDRIMDVYANRADDIPDPSGHMANRLCGEIEFSVSGPGYDQAHRLSGTNITFTSPPHNFGIIGNHFSNFSLFSGRDAVQGFTGSGFRINHDFPIYDGGPNGATISAGAPGGDYVGIQSLSGSIRYTGCELTTRSLPLDWYSPLSPGPHQLVFIEVSGIVNPTSVNGFVESGGEIHTDVIYQASGRFTTAFMLIDTDAATLEHLEQHCLGGYTYPPP